MFLHKCKQQRSKCQKKSILNPNIQRRKFPLNYKLKEKTKHPGPKKKTQTTSECNYHLITILTSASAVQLAELVDITTEARTEVKVGVHCAQKTRHTAARTGAMGLALLVLELAIAAVPWLALGAEQPFPRTSFYMLAALCVAILLTTALLYVFYTSELKSLQSAEDQMRLAVGGLQERLRGCTLPPPPQQQPDNLKRSPPEDAFHPEE